MTYQRSRNMIRRVDAAAALTAIVTVLIFSGCSVLTVPTPEVIIDHPLGTESIKIGMTKQQVEDLWGKPDDIKFVENPEKWKGTKEMWVYRAQYAAIPVDAGYLSKTKKLYFDGENLTEIGE